MPARIAAGDTRGSCGRDTAASHAARSALVRPPQPVLMCAAMNPTHIDSARVSKPLSVVAVLLTAFVFSSAFIVGCGGGGTEGGATSGTEDHGTETAGTTEGATGGDAVFAQGQTIYAEKCALCHGATGYGDGPGAAALDPKPRNHTDGAYMNAQTNEALHEVIKNGKGQMPAWGATMSDEEIDAVISYLRTLAEPKYTGEMP